MAAEIVLRRLDPRGPHAGEPLAVARDDRIGRIEGADEIFRDGSRRPVLGAAEKCPGTFAETLHQLRLRQQLEMARYARLRLAQDFGELRHGEFRFGQEAENAQTGFLPGCLEGGVQIIEGDPRDHGGTLPNRLGQDGSPVNSR